MPNLTDRLGGASSSLSFKAPLVAGSTGNLTSLSGFQVMDGVTLSSTMHPDLRRVLVKAQTDASQNGLYEMQTGTWQRTKDFNSVADFRKGTRVFVNAGASQGGGYIVTSEMDPEVFEIDDDDIDFAAEVTSSAVSELLFQAFQTKAAVEAATLTAATLYLSTIIYSVAVDGGGARYKRVTSEPSHAGKIRSLDRFLPNGTESASNGGWWELIEPVLLTTMFGMSPSNSAADNMTALKATIAALADGQVMQIPDMGGVANIDTTGGLTGAATIAVNDVTVIIDGHLKANYSDEEANPAFIFNVTGRNVKFRGSGTLEGDGAFQLGGVHSSEFPGLVYVLGNNFSCQGLRLRRPPQCAFLVVGDRASICHNHFEGGPITWEASTIAPEYTVENEDYIGSGHFHIVASGSAGSDFSHNRFVPDEAGGVVVNAIFSAGSTGEGDFTRVVGNLCVNAWEKLFYGYGTRNIVVGNTIRAEAPYGFTDAIRIWGNYSLVALNVVEGTRSVAQLFDCVGSRIMFNTCVNIRDSGINVQHITDTAGGFTDVMQSIVVKGNLIVRGTSAETVKHFGIRLQGHADNHMIGIEVTDNMLIGWGLEETNYAIELNPGTGNQIQHSKVSDNFMINCASGIRATRFAHGQIKGNRFWAMTHVWIDVLSGNNIEVDGNFGGAGGTYGLSMGTGGSAPTSVRFTNNCLFGTSNIAIRNFTFDSATENWAEGNQWTDAALFQGATLSAAATTTVTHGGVASHATIALYPTSATFAALMASKGLYTEVATNDFTVKTGDAAAAGGTETFRYKILQ